MPRAVDDDDGDYGDDVYWLLMNDQVGSMPSWRPHQVSTEVNFPTSFTLLYLQKDFPFTYFGFVTKKVYLD